VIVDPAGGSALQVTKQVGKRAVGAETDQQVNVVFGAVDDDGDAVLFVDDAPEVGVEARLQVRGDLGAAVFGGEDDVVEKLGIGAGHGPFFFRP
jgi:hypothetical protein